MRNVSKNILNVIASDHNENKTIVIDELVDKLHTHDKGAHDFSVNGICVLYNGIYIVYHSIQIKYKCSIKVKSMYFMVCKMYILVCRFDNVINCIWMVYTFYIYIYIYIYI